MVLSVPCVAEAAVARHVAVGVVGELFGVLRHEDAARDGAHIIWNSHDQQIMSL